MKTKTLSFCLLIPLLIIKAQSERCRRVVLTSTLAITNRDYACPFETVVITCSGGIGTELVWDYITNGTKLPPFVFDDNNANLPDARLVEGIIVYLTNRTNSPNGTFQFTSQLLIERITDDSANVTCTVTSDPINMTDTDVCCLSIRMSGVPDKPTLKTVPRNQLGCVGQNENTSQHLLEWMPPDNIDTFDLSHYEVNITGPNIYKTFRCIETSTIFSLDATADDIIGVNISIVAVNLCGQSSNAMEKTRMIQLGKCQSQGSSSIALKFSSTLVALLMIATVFAP